MLFFLISSFSSVLYIDKITINESIFFLKVCNQTEESIGAVETIINDFQNNDNYENASNSGTNIPIIVCMNKMDSKVLGDDVEER